jgi:hypothetical protein
MEGLTCTNCGGAATLISEEGVINTYVCNSCGSKIETIVHYIEQPIDLGIDYYRAIVSVPNKLDARKAAIKIRKIFSGKSNFYEGNLQKQIDEGSDTLSLGIYSGLEVKELAEMAKMIDLDLKFVYDSSV